MCRWKVRCLLAFALLCLSQAGKAQAVRIYDTENGLPHNRVNRIYLDSKNFLWICTDDGLSRFDGHQFVNYTTADGIPHRYVNAVLETRAGEYWVASDGGLSRFDPKPGKTRFTTYVPAGPEEARHINDLIEGSDGSLLLATSLGPFRFSLQGHSLIFEPLAAGSSSDPPNTVMVNAIAQDAFGSLWLATDHGLYQRARNAGWRHYATANSLGLDPRVGIQLSTFVSSFSKERNGRLWAVFKGGFGRIAIDPKPGTRVLELVQTDPSAFHYDLRALWFGTNGRRWIASNAGLTEWIVDSEHVSRFRELAIQSKFPREAVLSIAEDNTGNLWVGTRRSGLLRMGSSQFLTFGASEGLQLGRDQMLLELQSGQISVFDVGGKRSQLYRQTDGQRFVAILPALPQQVASTPNVSHMAIEDHTGAWWFSTISGLFRFPALDRGFDLRLVSGCEVDRFFEDAATDIWISKWCRGERSPTLARWERKSGVVHDESDRLPPGARNSSIASFAQDRRGIIWIGLWHSGGLLRLVQGRFQPISASLRGHINQLFFDSQGRLWVTSTENGLSLIADPNSSDPQVRRYTRAQGLSSDEVWCITEDLLGRIYAGTAQGVDRLDLATGRITHYSSADGLVHGDIRSAIRDRQGDLWFASANGVSRFRPGQDRKKSPSEARITGLRAGGVPFPLLDFGEAELADVKFFSHQNSLQIDFAATDFHALAPLRYQFLLDPPVQADREKVWQAAGTNPSVYLVNLPPGDHSFAVRALTPDGVPGKPASFVFSILRPFWRTWWFQLACAAAILLLAYWVHKQRLDRRLAVERVRNHIALDLHDDIGASLSRISVIGEALKSRLRGGDEDVQRMLNDIADSSRRVIKDMSDVVWSLDPRRDQIGDLASRLRVFGSDLLETRGVEWTVDAPSEKLHQKVPSILRRQLYLILKEGIHNIGKHSDATKASLQIWLRDGDVCGELTDDGRGIPPGSKHGMGILSMRARAKQGGGNLEISTMPGGGTSIRVHLPLSNRA
jgi:signal transduction histidine kinase/ligand-binding sensor domain-containing protein